MWHKADWDKVSTRRRKGYSDSVSTCCLRTHCLHSALCGIRADRFWPLTCQVKQNPESIQMPREDWIHGFDAEVHAEEGRRRSGQEIYQSIAVMFSADCGLQTAINRARTSKGGYPRLSSSRSFSVRRRVENAQAVPRSELVVISEGSCFALRLSLRCMGDTLFASSTLYIRGCHFLLQVYLGAANEGIVPQCALLELPIHFSIRRVIQHRRENAIWDG